VRRLRIALGTLRWRLTLTYVALLALLLAGLGTYQYLALQDNLVSVRVDALQGDVDQLQVEIQQLLPRAARTPAGVATALATVCARLNRTAPAGAAADAATERTIATALIAASGRTATVVVYDRFLQPVVSMPTGLDSAPHMSDGALRTALGGRRSGAEVLDTGAGNQLAAAFPIARPGGTCGVAQLSTSTQPIDDVLISERERLAIGGALVLLAALLLGLVLTSRALQPLHRVADTARRLAGGDLRARSSLPRTGEVGALAASFDDMADRIEVAFAAQAESEARMRRFVADASHELRTPITALKGYIDVMRRGAVREPQAVDAALETMAREADRMRILVLDLLTLARLDAQRPMEAGPVDLNAVLAAVLDEGRDLAGMPPPEQLRRDLSAAPVVVMADPNAITAIARNLLGNAVKYAPGAPQRWTTAAAGGHGVFTAHDDGPGIPAADVPHLFERFYRGEKTRAREEGGSGLGLSIVQGLATAMGGDVSLHTEEGRGTTVTVRLPLAAQPARAQPPIPG
jgi:two-component system, OmpR family, sensor kinase